MRHSARPDCRIEMPSSSLVTIEASYERGICANPYVTYGRPHVISRPRFGAHGIEADINLPTTPVESVENDPERAS